LRAVASAPTISAIGDVSLVLGGVALLTEKDGGAEYQQKPGVREYNF
jgi:hypothetical protein